MLSNSYIQVFKKHLQLNQMKVLGPDLLHRLLYKLSDVERAIKNYCLLLSIVPSKLLSYLAITTDDSS